MTQFHFILQKTKYLVAVAVAVGIAFIVWFGRGVLLARVKYNYHRFSKVRQQDRIVKLR